MMERQSMRNSGLEFTDDPAVTVTALSVSRSAADHVSIESIFNDSGWTLHKAGSLESALSILRSRRIGVVLCEGDSTPNMWKDILELLPLLRTAPPLIVTSRLADDRLWAEALNLGAYDVLAKPFDSRELTRTVHLAWLHWDRSRDSAGRGGARVLAAAGD